MFIPRIGMEVRVEFLEGDPDQPIITGCVYNAGAMPPYKLPAEKTKMSIKSDSSPGGGGFNEIRFEDKKGSEQIFMHGEKDMDVRIKNDRRELIGRDDHLIVKRDERERVMRDIHRIVERDVVEEIKRDSHQKVTGKTATEIGQSVSNKVGTNMAEEIGGNYSSKVTGNYSIKAKQIVLEAEAGLTINVGGNFVTILPAGVFIKGTMVFINSGGSALPGVPGQLVPPMAVAEAEIADNADPGSKAPSYKHQRQQQTPMQALKFNSPSHKPNASQSNSSQSGSSAEDNEKKKTWIEIKLVDQDGNPVPGEEYIVKLPDGQTVATGTLDENGFARVDNIDPGNCEVIFPNLDARIWNKK
jgi:type VI secretion system secreted protein VgrG